MLVTCTVLSRLSRCVSLSILQFDCIGDDVEGDKGGVYVNQADASSNARLELELSGISLSNTMKSISKNAWRPPRPILVRSSSCGAEGRSNDWKSMVWNSAFAPALASAVETTPST